MASGAQDEADLQRQVFDASQRAERLGLAVQLVAQALREFRLADVGDGRDVSFFKDSVIKSAMTEGRNARR